MEEFLDDRVEMRYNQNRDYAGTVTLGEIMVEDTVKVNDILNSNEFKEKFEDRFKHYYGRVRNKEYLTIFLVMNNSLELNNTNLISECRIKF